MKLVERAGREIYEVNIYDIYQPYCGDVATVNRARQAFKIIIIIMAAIAPGP